MTKILIADTLDPSGLSLFADAGVEVYQLKAEERPRLPEILADFDALVVRSSTQATAELLRAGKKLKVVGRAGIGVDNVDVAAATELGILVVNAPTANLMSATEHTFALLLSLARKVPEADASTKAGGWDRKITGVELQGKTLGVIGFGRIGQRVADRARAFEMKIVAYDPFLDSAAARKLDVELLPIDELLAVADVITFHTPLTKDSKNLLNRERLAKMKKGALIVNCGRGGVIDEDALYDALESGHIGGAALDVFAEEPPKDLKLVRHKNVVVTPHLGAQTREAQERISIQTAEMVLAALSGSLAVAAVNLPFRPTGGGAEPLMALGETLGRMAGSLLGAAPQSVQVNVWGVDDSLRAPRRAGRHPVRRVRAAGGALRELSAGVPARRQSPGDGEPRQARRGRQDRHPARRVEHQHRRHPPRPPRQGLSRRPPSRSGAHAGAAGKAREARRGEVGAPGFAGIDQACHAPPQLVLRRRKLDPDRYDPQGCGAATRVSRPTRRSIQRRIVAYVSGAV
jgi:D-3-phosphoglycerate dehydrogenase